MPDKPESVFAKDWLNRYLEAVGGAQGFEPKRLPTSPFFDGFLDLYYRSKQLDLVMELYPGKRGAA